MKASEWLITPEKRQRPRATRPAASAADDTGSNICQTR